MTRILLIEDELGLARSLRAGLQEEQYIVDHAADGEAALWQAKSQQHDAMILDLRIPVVSGLEVCRRLRAARSQLPILMLTACDAPEDVVLGLDAGADDYLTKPFVFAELLARLRALVRRGSAGTSAVLQIGDLALDTVRRQVTRGGEAIALSNMEYRVLEHLVRHAGAVQTKARIAAALWSDEIGPASNVLEVHIANLRKKLDSGRSVRLIHTRRGVGYLVSSEPQ